MKIRKFDLKSDVYDAPLSEVEDLLDAKFDIPREVFRTAFDNRYNQCRVIKLGN